MHSNFSENFVKTRFNTFTHTNKKFISLNGRRNTTRLYMIFAMRARGLLEQGHVSLLPASWKHTHIPSWRDSIVAVMHLTKKTSEFSVVPSNAKFIDDLVLDRDMHDQDTASNVMSNVWLEDCDVSKVLDGPYHDSLQPIIDESFFTVINETLTHTGDPIFFTEKTFKPIQYAHPFILCSVPGALAKLRELGYKTFHPHIDESYDLEVDNLTRYVKILEQIKLLCNMSEQQTAAFLDATRDIVEHNYKTLRDKTNWIYNERTLD